MDAVFGGVLMAMTLALAVIYWHLLVRPELVLSFLHDVPMAGWFDEQRPVGLRALRWVTGALLLVLGFLTGLAWTFFLSTV